MDFADEHYVKLFTRDTVTWRSWPWQARTVLALLLRKVDAAGFLDLGRLEPAAAVSIMLDLPREVAEPGLNELLTDGTAEVVDRRLLLSNFVAAQESRKTDKAKARDYRERKKTDAREAARAKQPEHQDQAVTARHQPSPAVTPTNPPALLCSARPLPELLPPAKKPRAARRRAADVEAPDPRQPALVKAIDESFSAKRGTAYPFGPIDFGVIKRLLKRRPSHEDALWPIELAAGWGRALDSSFPGCSTLFDYEKQLAKHLGTGPPGGSAARAQHTGFTGSGPITSTEGVP